MATPTPAESARRDAATAGPWLRVHDAVLTALAVAALTLLGAVLRMHALGAKSLWVDEGVSVWVARKSVPDLLAWLARGDVHPPLYFLLLHYWLRVDDSVAWIRLLSVIPSVLTIPLVYGLGRRLAGSAVGLLAALLLAVSPFSVTFAQDARMYPLLGLTATFASYCLVWGLQSPRVAPWAGYAAGVAAVLYTQNLGLFVIVAHGVLLVTAALSGRRAANRGLLALTVGLLAWGPWLPAVRQQAGSTTATWVANPAPHDLSILGLSFLSHLLPDPVRVAPGAVPLDALRPLANGAALLVLALGLLALRRRGTALWALLLLAGPIVFELDAGLLRPVFIDRNLIPVAIVYLVVLAAGLVRLARPPRGRVPAALLLGVLLLLNATGLAHYYRHYDKEHWDHAAAYVAAHQEQGDVLLFQGNSSQLPFDYYYARATTARLPAVAVPCSLDGCFRFESPPDEGDRVRLAASVSGNHRVWLVKRWWGNWDFALADAVGPEAAGRLRLVQERDLGGVVVQRYEADGR